MTKAAETAKAIRKELKAKFPNIKFSVRSESFSMGNAVNVKYTDGVPREEVEKVLYKYEYGKFNSMEDMYEMDNVREDIPQVKYVTVSREISDKIKEETKYEIAEQYGMDNPEDQQEWMEKFGMWPEQKVWTVLQNKSFA